MGACARVVVALFLSFQLIYPLRYYASSHDKTVDFGAWRMFSSRLWDKASVKYYSVSPDVVRVDLRKGLRLPPFQARYFSRKPTNWACEFLLEELCRRLPAKPSRVFAVRETFWYWDQERVSHQVLEHNCSR